MSHVIKSRVLTRAINARLRNFQYDSIAATELLPLRDVYFPALEGAKPVEISFARHRWKGEKIVQEITRNVANIFSFYAIIAIEHGFSMH